MTIYKCNKCGETETHLIEVKIDFDVLYLKDYIGDIHLCRECLQQFKGWLNNNDRTEV